MVANNYFDDQRKAINVTQSSSTMADEQQPQKASSRQERRLTINIIQPPQGITEKDAPAPDSNVQFIEHSPTRSRPAQQERPIVVRRPRSRSRNFLDPHSPGGRSQPSSPGGLSQPPSPDAGSYFFYKSSPAGSPSNSRPGSSSGPPGSAGLSSRRSSLVIIKAPVRRRSASGASAASEQTQQGLMPPSPSEATAPSGSGSRTSSRRNSLLAPSRETD